MLGLGDHVAPVRLKMAVLAVLTDVIVYVVDAVESAPIISTFWMLFTVPTLNSMTMKLMTMLYVPPPPLVAVTVVPFVSATDPAPSPPALVNGALLLSPSAITTALVVSTLVIVAVAVSAGAVTVMLPYWTLATSDLPPLFIKNAMAPRLPIFVHQLIVTISGGKIKAKVEAKREQAVGYLKILKLLELICDN